MSQPLFPTICQGSISEIDITELDRPICRYITAVTNPIQHNAT